MLVQRFESRKVRALEISIIITITLQYSRRRKSIAVSVTELVFGSNLSLWSVTELVFGSNLSLWVWLNWSLDQIYRCECDWTGLWIKSIAVSVTELVFGSLGHCGGRMHSASARSPDTQTCHVRPLPAKRLRSLAVLCKFITLTISLQLEFIFATRGPELYYRP